MKHETSAEKWTRLQGQIQAGILHAYPNPQRNGCPGDENLVILAMRSAKFDDSIENDRRWQHVTHCSPCYREYLKALKNLR